ncbi:MAG TPA: c-type cytochrome biogenesis protein CcmI [Pyrinomonadaceae bacterium]
MMSFWIFAGLLVAIALCYVLPPLLQRAERTDDERERANVSIYRDQLDELDRDLRDGVLDKEQYEQGRLELQRRLLEDVAPAQDAPMPVESNARSGRSAALILGGAIPLLAVILYFKIPPEPVRSDQRVMPSAPEEEAAEAPVGQPSGPTPQEIEQRVANLAARLKENPNDDKGWVMLARSYKQFKRYREASDAYARATELVNDNPQLWLEYAEALALANGSQLQGRPLELINKALQLDPENKEALWMAGTAAFEAQDFRQAISYWERLEKLLPAGSQDAQFVSGRIEEARARIK